MKIRKEDDVPLPLWLELEHPRWDLIQYQEKACQAERIPYIVLWHGCPPCLVCTWEHFSLPLSDYGQQRLAAQARRYIEKRRDTLRKHFPHLGLSFSVCRWQCSFERLPDPETGRALAAELSDYLTGLFRQTLEEDHAD
ncbi:hypothetical protein ACVPTE_23480 [Salmonella enterica subsp. enterica serovar Winslow]|uniref:hypothetical protein n=1 Tax=Salmonella enterica TaxID=28901 RepID=UPI0016045FC7|nr:hypothetical protein [Salmonella enterica]ECL7345062.1 hypothetical protein [Salmonella enterica subsp. enterica serovar Menston]ELV9460664.1 hypothetical protein [Salmonella enterica]